MKKATVAIQWKIAKEIVVEVNVKNNHLNER